MRRLLLLSLLLLLGLSAPAWAATTYYVAQSGGLDTNPGTTLAPFQTVQKCASTAGAGDTCVIRSGTYRETVTPAQSGSPSAVITFQADVGATVTLSGADVVTGWAVSSGSIYRANAVGWTLGQGNNQAYVDGQALVEARYPNGSQDFSHPPWGLTDGGGPSYFTDANLTQPSGFWTGGLMILMDGTGYKADVFPIVGSSPGRIDLAVPWSGGAGYLYYLASVRNALDAAGEWYMDGSGVYVWTWDSTNPAGHTVEVKRRAVALELASRSYITVQGINLFAASVHTNSSSHHLLLDGLQVKYPSYFYGGDWNPGPKDTGMILDGDHNILQNCTVAWAAGSGLILRGDHHTIFNCTFSDFNYGATGAAGIFASNYDTYSNASTWGYHSITYNTFRHGGRDGIEHIFNKGLLISHNLFEDVMIQTQDGGATYTWETDGANTEISYNIIRNSTPLNYSGNIMFAIYFDQDNNQNFSVHHNLIYNLTGQACGVLFNGGNSVHNTIYNNTMWNTGAVGGIHLLTSGDVLTYNNLSEGPIIAPNMLNNKTAVSGDFVNLAAGNFQLQAGSGAVDAGRVIPGITDGYVGAAPDVGAYERGVIPWVAGASASIVPPTANPIYVSVGGHGDTPLDSNSCTAAENPLTPKRNLASALPCMTAAGKVLYVRGGTYTETIDTATQPITGGTSWTAPTRIEGYQAEVATLALSASTATVGIFFRAATDSYIEVRNLTVDGTNQGGSNGIALYAVAHHVRLTNVTVKNTTFEPLFITGANAVEVVTSTLMNSTADGIGLSGAIANLVLQGNTIHHHAGYGIRAHTDSGSHTNLTLTGNRLFTTGTGGSTPAIGLGPGRGLLLANNLIYTNQAGVLLLTGNSGAKVYNNTIVNNTGAGLQCNSGATSALFTNDIVFGNGSAIVNNCGATLTTNLTTADPLFTNAGAGDFTVLAGSPALDTGTTVAEVTTSFNGLPRPQGSGYDIGAYDQSGAGVPPPGTTFLFWLSGMLF